MCGYVGGVGAGASKPRGEKAMKLRVEWLDPTCWLVGFTWKRGNGWAWAALYLGPLATVYLNSGICQECRRKAEGK